MSHHMHILNLIGIVVLESPISLSPDTVPIDLFYLKLLQPLAISMAVFVFFYSHFVLISKFCWM